MELADGERRLARPLYDAIVIGARCAGASTAMLLARAGHSVLLVDRARFPSEIPHGHFIHRHGPARLSRWGLLDRVLATGCPAVTSLLVDFGDFLLAGHELVVDGVPVGLGPRRGALDGVLVSAAVEAGAELREGFVVDELVFADGRVVGIEGRSGGKRVREQARFVIGADGRNSGVAKRVEAPAYDAVPTLSIWYFSYWSGVPGEALELYQRGRRIIFAFPTNDELYAVFVGWPAAELDTVRRSPEEALLAAVDLAPELAERMRGGRREERLLGATQLPNFLREARRPRLGACRRRRLPQGPVPRARPLRRLPRRGAARRRTRRGPFVWSKRSRGARRVRAPPERRDAGGLPQKPRAGPVEPAAGGGARGPGVTAWRPSGDQPLLARRRRPACP